MGAFDTTPSTLSRNLKLAEASASHSVEAVMAMTHSRSRPVTASTWRATV